MTQRVFDMENEKDIKDLFDILPDWVMEVSLFKDSKKGINRLGTKPSFLRIFYINWHSKTHVSRPVNKSKWIGCLCRFWDDDKDCFLLGVLDRIVPGDSCPYKPRYERFEYKNCRPVMRNEIKFAEDNEK